jgi:hypothetical protein
MNTSIKTSPSFALQTLDGQTVYGNGCGKYSLTYNKWGTSIPTHEKVGDNTPEGRAKRLAKAQDQVGQPLQWVDGPVIEYIPL